MHQRTASTLLALLTTLTLGCKKKSESKSEGEPAAPTAAKTIAVPIGEPAGEKGEAVDPRNAEFDSLHEELDSYLDTPTMEKYDYKLAPVAAHLATIMGKSNATISDEDGRTDYYIKCAKERCVVASLTINKEVPTEIESYDLRNEEDRWGASAYKLMLWQAEHPGQIPKSALTPKALEKIGESLGEDEAVALVKSKLQAAGAGQVDSETETVTRYFAISKEGCGVLEVENDEENKIVYGADYEFLEPETGEDVSGSYALCVMGVLGN